MHLKTEKSMVGEAGIFMCARVKCLAVRYRFKKLNAAIHNFNS